MQISIPTHMFLGWILWIPELHLTNLLKQSNTALERRMAFSRFVLILLFAAQLNRYVQPHS